MVVDCGSGIVISPRVVIKEGSSMRSHSERLYPFVLVAILVVLPFQFLIVSSLTMRIIIILVILLGFFPNCLSISDGEF